MVSRVKRTAIAGRKVTAVVRVAEEDSDQGQISATCMAGLRTGYSLALQTTVQVSTVERSHLPATTSRCTTSTCVSSAVSVQPSSGHLHCVGVSVITRQHQRHVDRILLDRDDHLVQRCSVHHCKGQSSCSPAWCCR